MSLKRSFFPLTIFLLVWIIHYLWLMVFSEVASTQGQWVTFDETSNATPWTQYIATKSYYLSYTYAICLAFTAAQYRRYREQRSCTAGKVAFFGTVGFSGALSVGGCFLLGCCGSPMLGVYLSLLGASIVPLAKPLIAGVSTLILFGAWYRIRRNEMISSAPAATTVNCECD